MNERVKKIEDRMKIIEDNLKASSVWADLTSLAKELFEDLYTKKKKTK